MLTVEENERMCRIGPGTLMGELLRRYWHPVAAAPEFEKSPVKGIRLFGEDLVLYRDGSGTYGLLGRHCPHRRADLSYGWVEDCGLRCSYHGWHFDETGKCLEQPFEDSASANSRFRSMVQQKAYRAEEKAGLVWAYLGPEPAPLVPTWEPFTWENGFVQVVLSEVPCNWLQGQDNSIDPVHFEWLHENWTQRLKGVSDYKAPEHRKLAFDEFQWGFTYRRIRENFDETSEQWAIGRVCLWPNALFTKGHFEWRVPIDDENTLSVAWFYDPVPADSRPYRQGQVAHWYSPIRDPETGRWITSHIMNQDFVAWVGQGRLSDREAEQLGRSDRGVLMMRHRLLEDAESVANGGEPKGLVRDPAANHCITLPMLERDRLERGPSRTEFLQDYDLTCEIYGGPFQFLAGQPEAVRKAYEKAMGL